MCVRPKCKWPKVLDTKREFDFGFLDRQQSSTKRNKSHSMFAKIILFCSCDSCRTDSAYSLLVSVSTHRGTDRNRIAVFRLHFHSRPSSPSQECKWMCNIALCIAKVNIIKVFSRRSSDSQIDVTTISTDE